MDENGENWPSKMVWKTVESQGKVSEKSGNFEMDIEWQPCYQQTTKKLLLVRKELKKYVVGAYNLNVLKYIANSHKNLDATSKTF